MENQENKIDIMADEYKKDIETLQETKKENLQYTNKNSYIKEKVFEFKKLWWDTVVEMMNSEDKDMKKAGVAEYNKLQSKMLPTELTGADGAQLPTALVINLNQDGGNANNQSNDKTETGMVEIGGQKN